MGRELQKKKNRSSVNKVRQKPKSKKVNIKGNPIIAANWNSSETFTQNYRRLGLTARLNAPTGGVEKHDPNLTSDNPHAAGSLAINPSTNTKALIPTEAHVERDESGAIVRVIHPPSSSSKRPNPLHDPLNELSDSDADPADTHPPHQYHQTDIVARLEDESKLEAPKKPRKQSRREEEWVEQLVTRHRDDYRAMFWDRKLNPRQQSEADIRKRVERWKGRKTRERVETG